MSKKNFKDDVEQTVEVNLKRRDEAASSRKNPISLGAGDSLQMPCSKLIESNFKKTAGFLGIHSVGDFFKVALRGGWEVFMAIVNLAFRR